MINKQNLWFITLFSLILILGVYYVSMPENALEVFSGNITDTSETIEVTNSDLIVALKVEEEEKLLSQMEEAQNILLNTEATADEKNEAYQTLQMLNSKKGKVLEIEELIKEKYNINSCVTIDGDKISITLSSKDEGKEYANNIIRTIQELYDNQMYITVKFENK